ncbi:WD and tetratricopeptide repeats protein 1-like [Tripterygium wilfordii]|uniref:WD and tetratricopeptide repeats protein 1-like n=1 Tax=Tripterygium wilfordii TaxID=458696 RepID=UPI0018F8559E|nr:WD and tetratricopeptide repeats protein 1-like [Tripterygium wilfordii]
MLPMENLPFHDGNIYNLIENRHYEVRRDVDHTLQMHSSFIRRLSQETELEGHQGCVNSVAWNSKGSLLISGSDDTQMNIWSYNSRKLLYSIDTGHSANIFCTRFVPETSDELVVSGAGDAEVRLFNLSRLSGRTPDDNAIAPLALYQCHTRRVKKLAVESGNPNVVWSASEDGTLRQHDFREGNSCPPAGSSHQECRNILVSANTVATCHCEYVASGSDDGRWYIWEKKTGRLVKILHGDEAVVNCVQGHPYNSVVATSGIDNTIKIWSPNASVPSVVAGGAAGPETADMLDIMENNQRKLCRKREAILPFELLERFRLREFTEGTFHPFECAQS